MLSSGRYPKKIWTKFESDLFRERFGKEAVIPIWFSNAMPGLFDESRKVGGIGFDGSAPMGPQVAEIVKVLLLKLEETRHAGARQGPKWAPA